MDLYCRYADPGFEKLEERDSGVDRKGSEMTKGHAKMGLRSLLHDLLSISSAVSAR